MAASSSISSSPLCTWLVAAACMSIDCDNKPSLFHSSKRFTRWARRRRSRTSSSSAAAAAAVGVGRDFPSLGFMSSSSSSSLCGGSSIQGLMSSCLAFEPCQEYYNSLAFFGGDGFSLFGGGGGSKATTTMMTSRQRQRRRMMNSPVLHAAAAAAAAAGGETMPVDVQPSEEASIREKPLTKQRRVVVTGMGVVSSVGHDPDVFYNNLLEGVSGITEIESFDCSNYSTRIAGEIKSLSTEGWIAPKLARRVDKFMTYMLTAGKKALADAGVSEDVMAELDKSRCGVLIGSGMGGMQVFHDAVEALRISVRKVNPFCIPFATTNMGSAILAMDLGWMGPNYSISTACATSNFCILNAANHIIEGEADVMLCGGSDAVISPLGMGGFVACRALSQRNDDPTKASRPWDTNRDGFVMGEGAGVLLLEELEHAKVILNFINDSEKRGAHIYAEFLGGSFTCDAYHMTEPHPNGRGVILCIENALAQSGVAREDVNYVNAHATSTQAGDLKEFQSLMHCFGQNPDLRVNSTKSMIGHLLGAAGAVEAVATIQAIRTGWVHPNINLENPEEAVDTKVLVGPKKERLDIKVALSNSFGFGGHNASILFAPYK